MLEQISDKQAMDHFMEVNKLKKKKLTALGKLKMSLLPTKKEEPPPKIVIFKSEEIPEELAGEYEMSEALEHMKKKTIVGKFLLKIYKRDLEWEAKHT